MNIFHLSQSPILAARAQHDRHVVKMILESCQLLSGAIHECDLLRMSYDSACKKMPHTVDVGLYKPTHLNHPSAIWTRADQHNFAWLTMHLSELLDEYYRRFPGRVHKCSRLLTIFAATAAGFRDFGFFVPTGQGIDGSRVSPQWQPYLDRINTFEYCGPKQYRVESVIESYRAYYIAEKLDGNRYTRHGSMNLPLWLLNANPQIVDRAVKSAGRKPKRLFKPAKNDTMKHFGRKPMTLNLSLNR